MVGCGGGVQWWGGVVGWLEHWTLKCENPDLNPLAAVSKLSQFCSLHIALVHSAI